MTTRRGFLSALGAGLATVALSTRLGTTRIDPVHVDDERWFVYLRDRTQSLARSMLATKEQAAANVLNRAFVDGDFGIVNLRFKSYERFSPPWQEVPRA